MADIFLHDVELFGEELARLNAAPSESRLKYIDQRQHQFNTPHDQLQQMGFPTEYWDSVNEIPPDILALENGHINK